MDDKVLLIMSARSDSALGKVACELLRNRRNGLLSLLDAGAVRGWANEGSSHILQIKTDAYSALAFLELVGKEFPQISVSMQDMSLKIGKGNRIIKPKLINR